MSTASRRADFFVLEAAEYVNDLNQLVSQREPPDAERLVRGARALRGAALMAGLGTFARASASLESIARGVRDHALAWDPHARRGWQEGLATLRGLVGRATTWAAEEDRQALALSERLERIAGGQATPEVPPPQTAVLTPGVRAFIARESVLIAGSLE
ncbi:MAG: Hpt domain-containing protein, partial [Gemmatimonadales bacterium]|nr:Hpt domain-containing protein [Gemmatimonadales bacterium]